MIGNSGLIRPLQIDCELGAKAVKLRSPVTPQVRLTGSVCFVRGPAMDVRRSFYLMPRSRALRSPKCTTVKLRGPMAL